MVSSPWRIVEDCGAAFAMGTVGGSIFHGIKGFRNAPSGYKHRFAGSLISVRQKATLTGAGFAAWGGMFSVVDCSLAHIRKKEDAWNSVGSGFITGGLLQIRRKKITTKTLRIFCWIPWTICVSRGSSCYAWRSRCRWCHPWSNRGSFRWLV